MQSEGISPLSPCAVDESRQALRPTRPAREGSLGPLGFMQVY